MKPAIPASTANAPIAIPIAVPPLSPLSPDVAVVETTGAAVVVVVGICDGDSGRPGDNGEDPGVGVTGADAAGAVAVACEAVLAVLPPPFDPAASAAPGISPATEAMATNDSARRNIPPTYRSEASGCSIAGVSGASL